MKMNKEPKKLIPELRFPEFVKDGEWEKKALESFCLNISSGKDNNIIDGEFVLYGSTGIIGRTEKASYYGDFILVARVGANAGLLNKVNGKFGVTDNTLVVNLKKKEIIDFVFYSLEKFGLNCLVFGSGQPLITGTQLKSLNLLIPKTENEQQKIASCLSSLDEVIAAHSQKLELLKTHKKGLMQNLFPQVGETVPKWRFKEFENEGEWVEKTLGEIAENFDSKRVPITSNQREKGDIPYYGASGIIDFVKGYIYNETLLCISEDGANLIDRNYPIAFSISGKTWVNNHAHVLKIENTSTQLLVEKYINSINVEGFLTGMAQPKLNRGKLDIIPIPLSKNPNEQQKIADCLSSLDILITAQAVKIEQLKLHKKGLMQGLFPSITN